MIAVIEPNISTLFGIYASDASLATVFPDMRGTTWYIKAASGVDMKRLADHVESALLRYGADTQPIRSN